MSELLREDELRIEAVNTEPDTVTLIDPDIGLLLDRLREARAVVEKLPDMVAARLIQGGYPKKAARRLVLEFDQGLKGPGWCEAAIASQVLDAAREAMEPPPAPRTLKGTADAVAQTPIQTETQAGQA